MFTFEQKRKEATLHLSDLRRKLTNRQATGRSLARMMQRQAIAQEIIDDYERAIERVKPKELL